MGEEGTSADGGPGGVRYWPLGKLNQRVVMRLVDDVG
jgi:hypothetical protein